MKPPLRLYLIRHGETDYNLKRVIQGHGEVPLNTTGKKQAARLGERLRAEGIELIYSSDVRRAAMTAEILASHIGAPIEFDALWRERNPGDLIHKPYDEAGAFFSDPDYAPKGGEGVAEFDARIRAAAENLLKKEKARMARKAGARDAERTGAQRVAVVTHGMACASFLRQHFDYPPEKIRMIRWRNTSLTVAEYDGIWRVVTLSDASHLDEGEIADSQPPVIGG